MTGDTLLIWGLALLGISVILLVLEVFIPSGGVIAAVAGVCSLAGVIMLWRYDTTWGVLGLLFVLVVGPAGIYWALKTMPYTPVGRALLGGRPDDEVEAQEDAERDRLMRRKALVGQTGVAVADMHPVGEIDVGGEVFEALAEHAWIDAGDPVLVTHADGLAIRVRKG
jgi:membrane-bound ClpP family serine protease